MKTLIIARHAKSTWDNPDWTDYERPLNKRGIKNLPYMAVRLKDYLEENQPLIIASSANRTLITAKGYADELGISHSKIIKDINLDNKGMRFIPDFISKQDDTHDIIMIVGHNPTMTSSASFATGQHFQNVPTCGFVIVDYPESKWSEIKIDEGKLRLFDFPKKNKGDGK